LNTISTTHEIDDGNGMVDLTLARQIDSSAFSTDLIEGGERVVKYQLPNGNIIVEGDPTFRSYFSDV
jgi:hypothetical protein